MNIQQGWDWDLGNLGLYHLGCPDPCPHPGLVGGLGQLIAWTLDRTPVLGRTPGSSIDRLRHVECTQVCPGFRFAHQGRWFRLQ